MSPISGKKCPICYSILPSKVVFCPVCGTELQTNVVEKPLEQDSTSNRNFDSNYEQTYNYPSPRTLFGDEPIETSSHQDLGETNGNQFAWKVSDDLVPIKLKNNANYSELFNPPKIDLTFIKSLSVLELTLYILLGLSYSLIMMFQIGLSGILLSNVLTSYWVVALVLFLTFIPSSLITYFLNKKISQSLMKKKEKELNLSKNQILSYLFINGIHLLSIGMVSAVFMSILLPEQTSMNPVIAIYLSLTLVAFIVSVFSPIFRISKIMTSIRESGTLQNFQDSFQFPKISMKRYISISLFSYILPAALMIFAFQYIINLISPIILSENSSIVNSWDIAIGVLVWIILALIIVFSSIEDVKTTSYYEELLSKFIDPPTLNWINQGNQTSLTGSSLSDNHNMSNEPKELLCPACSVTLVEGAEFCTHCGKKIVK